MLIFLFYGPSYWGDILLMLLVYYNQIMKPANISNQRILTEVRKLDKENLSYLKAGPLPDDLYTWHFTFQGPENTEFHQGLYHGQILLPYQYPFKPPDIVFMNKNGRFETNTKICLTITQYHPEQWNSAWTIRTMLEAVISLFAENIQGVGSLSSSSDVRAFLAKNSHSYVCEKCGPIKNLLAPRPPQDPKLQDNKEKDKQQGVEMDRKKSEVVNRLEPPQLINFKSENVQTVPQAQRVNLKKERKQLVSELSFEQRSEARRVNDEQDRAGDGNEVIYVRSGKQSEESSVSFRKHAHKVRDNMRQLNAVFNTIKWV